MSAQTRGPGSTGPVGRMVRPRASRVGALVCGGTRCRARRRDDGSRCERAAKELPAVPRFANPSLPASSSSPGWISSAIDWQPMAHEAAFLRLPRVFAAAVRTQKRPILGQLGSAASGRDSLRSVAGRGVRAFGLSQFECPDPFYPHFSRLQHEHGRNRGACGRRICRTRERNRSRGTRRHGSQSRGIERARANRWRRQSLDSGGVEGRESERDDRVVIGGDSPLRRGRSNSPWQRDAMA